MKRFFVPALLVTCGFPAVVFSQRAQPPTMPRPTMRRESLERRVERQNEIRRREAEIESRLTKEKPQAGKNPLPVKPKRSKEQEQLLLPDSADTSRFAAFLRQPKTGLIRLFPDGGCQSSASVVRVAEQCSAYIPGSSFYSFREKEYTLEGLADIRYKNGFLISDLLVGQGILVTLGEVELENVSLDTEGVKFLTEYRPPVVREEALKQYAELSKGVIDGKYLYRNAMPVGENVTYVLRAVAYRGNFSGTLLEGDERKDIILAFRVVRKDKDNGVTLLWRELSRTEPPSFVETRN